MNETTRRFPRSTSEAIPAERAQCWEPPPKRPRPVLAGLLVLVALLYALAVWL